MKYAVFCAFISQILHLILCSISFLSCLVFSIIMINIDKTESINATENCLLLKYFLCQIFFTNRIIPYLFHSRLVQIKGFRYNMDKHIV